MKNKKTVLAMIICIMFICCEKRESQQKAKIESEPISPSQKYFDDYNNIDKIKELTAKMNMGDTISYKELMHIYFYSGHVKEFLYNSIKMADNYDYPLAYYNTYTILYSDNKKSKTNLLANYYLFLAYEKKSEHAEATIKERFGESFVIPESSQYWKSIN